MQIGQESKAWEKDEVEKKLGKWNDLPPNLSPATEEDYWRMLSVDGYREIVLRQPGVNARLWRNERKLVATREYRESMLLTSCLLYVRPDFSGLMVVIEYVPADYLKGEVITPAKHQPYFFKFNVCEHKRTETKKLGNCYYESKCLDCGFVTRVDSSD